MGASKDALGVESVSGSHGAVGATATKHLTKGKCVSLLSLLM